MLPASFAVDLPIGWSMAQLLMGALLMGALTMGKPMGMPTGMPMGMLMGMLMCRPLEFLIGFLGAEAHCLMLMLDHYYRHY